MGVSGPTLVSSSFSSAEIIAVSLPLFWSLQAMPGCMVLQRSNEYHWVSEKPGRSFPETLSLAQESLMDYGVSVEFIVFVLKITMANHREETN
jgi:predicted benzoate:H+ symporter BenE